METCHRPVDIELDNPHLLVLVIKVTLCLLLAFFVGVLSFDMGFPSLLEDRFQLLLGFDWHDLVLPFELWVTN